MKLSLRRCWPHTQPGLRRCHGNRQGLDPSQKAPDLDLAPQRGWQARAGWGWSLKSGSHAGRPVGGPCSQMASEVTHRAGLSPGCHGHRLPGPSPPPIPQGLRCVLPSSHVACLGRWREQGARARALGLLFLALPPFTTCVTLGQSLSLSEPDFFFFSRVRLNIRLCPLLPLACAWFLFVLTSLHSTWPRAKYTVGAQ